MSSTKTRLNPRYIPGRSLGSRRSTGLTVASLFAGAGGTALGFENAGFEHSFMVENDRASVATLRENWPDVPVFDKDLRLMDYDGLETDVIEAGFPCQSVSMAGYRRGFQDPRGAVFFELARAIDELQPRAVMAENVRGLTSHDAGRTLETILATFDDLNYDVAWGILPCQFMLVPQRRERFIAIATRRDLKIKPSIPRYRFKEIPLRKALEGVEHSEHQPYSEAKRAIMEQVPEGGNWRDLDPAVAENYMGKAWFNGGGRTAYARRLAWDQPSLTLTTSPSQKSTERCHPEETRPLTVSEYARVQTFPDSHTILGSTAAQYKQIGNAFPPNAAFFVAHHIADLLGAP